MKEVFVYVEGPSDQLGMRSLFANIINDALSDGNKIDFYPMYGKEPLLNNGPKKAVNILRNRPDSWVFLLPDLYPKNKPFPHSSYEELKEELERRFDRELQSKHCDEGLKKRFRVHCFKHDLEALVLASEDILMKRLGTEKFSRAWTIPVENQNHNQPPKRIVEALFSDIGMKYKDTADVPWILERSDCNDLKRKCAQNFGLFLNNLLEIIRQKERE